MLNTPADLAVKEQARRAPKRKGAMKTHKWSDLRRQMSPDAQRDVQKRVAQTTRRLDEIRRAEIRPVGGAVPEEDGKRRRSR